MKAPERDQLLIRLDERTCNIWRSVEQLEKHQVEQNGLIQELFISTSRNTIWRKVIIGVGGTIITVFITWLAKLQGLW